jgi:hypothetical protein
LSLDVAGVLAQGVLELGDRLAQASRTLVDAAQAIAQVGIGRVLGQRTLELLLGARVVAGVKERQPEIGPRLGRVETREAEIRIVGIGELARRLLEALGGALELPLVEVQDPPLVAPVPAP